MKANISTFGELNRWLSIFVSGLDILFVVCGGHGRYEDFSARESSMYVVNWLVGRELGTGLETN